MIGMADLNRLLIERFRAVREGEPNADEIHAWCEKNSIPTETLSQLSDYLIQHSHRALYEYVVEDHMEAEEAIDTVIGTTTISMFVLGFEAHREYGKNT